MILCCSHYSDNFREPEICDCLQHNSVKTTALLASSVISSQTDYSIYLLYGMNKYNVAKLKRFKMPFVELSLDLIKVAKFLPIFKNYLVPHFISHHVLKYNFITFKAIKFSQPIYLSPLIKISSLTHMEIGYLFTQFILNRPLVDKALQWLLPVNGKDSHNWSNHSHNNTVLNPVKTYLFTLAYPQSWLISPTGR